MKHRSSLHASISSSDLLNLGRSMPRVGLDPISRSLRPEDTEFPDLYPEAHFKHLEVLANVFGVAKLAADYSRRLLQALPAPEMSDADDLGKLEGSVLNPMRSAVAVGSIQALSTLCKRDPASMLVIARRVVALDGRVLDRHLSPEVLAVLSGENEAVIAKDPKLRAELLGVAKAEFGALVLSAMIPQLEKLVVAGEQVKALAALGVELTDLKSEVAKLEFYFPAISLDGPCKPTLLAIGATALRMQSAKTIATALQASYGGAAADSERSVLSNLRKVVFDSTIKAQPPGFVRTAQWEDRTSYDLVWALVFASRWAMHGFPVLQPTHLLAASNMMTTIPREVLPEIAAPWDTFLVEIPLGLLDDDSSFAAICHVKQLDAVDAAVGLSPQFMGGNGWVLMIFGPSARCERYVLQDLRDLCDLEYGKNYEAISRDVGMTKVKERRIELIGKLVLSMLIEVDADEHKSRAGRKFSPDEVLSDPRVKRGQKEPSQWVFQIRRPINVDARPAVDNYIATGSYGRRGQHGPIAVQTLVRGFKRRQPYGPKGSLRRWQHIEPYWRGPVDAPIAVHPHRVGNKP